MPQAEDDPAELVDTEALSNAADAAFVLAVLAATGVASPHVPLNDTWAVKALHAAAQGGSPEANLGLAHRYFMGDGVPANCQEGLRSTLSECHKQHYHLDMLSSALTVHIPTT